mmetsp:Transcript_40976/g.76174  ORF Transcript_40976/g.76174 Transcript_40976/m.76174 type:complete len:202 (+) Transcript_40976:92-697(+)
MLSQRLLEASGSGAARTCKVVLMSVACLGAVIFLAIPGRLELSRALAAPAVVLNRVAASDIDAVERMYALLAKGRLEGSLCEEAAKEFALNTTVFDASSDAMPHVPGARVFHGLSGVCEWFQFLATFRQPDYHIIERLYNGKGSVVYREALTPTVFATGKTTDHPLQNLVEYQVQEGKLSLMKVYWGEPHLFDSLFVMTMR